MTATNRGATNLRVRRRKEDPMRAYDALPEPVRHWLAQAALPWSPASCRKILRRARARGECLDDVLVRLDHAQQKTLARAAPYPSCTAPQNQDHLNRKESP